MVDEKLEQEAIQLRLRQWVSSLGFDGVLGCDDEKGSGKSMTDAVNGYGSLLHRLQQRRLRFCRRAIDFVGQQQLREHGTLIEYEVIALKVEHVLTRNI